LLRPPYERDSTAKGKCLCLSAKGGLLTEQEIETFYQAIKARLQGEKATVREQIRTQLQNQKLAAQRASVLHSLRSQTIVVVDLKASLGFRVQVSADGGPSKGGATAPVTIVECSDFHCPFCKRVLPTSAQIESQYGDNVTLVLRDDPID
jgi:protein-disulfide isomerase